MAKPLPCFRIGDLVWCRWNTIWWPAMISYDPHSAIYFKATNDCISSYHLQYFGILARRGWVNCRLLFPMKSIDEKKSKTPLNKKTRNDYNVAMTEAEQAFNLGLKQRKLTFIFNFAPPVAHHKKKHSVSNKSVTTSLQASHPSSSFQNTPPSLLAGPLTIDTIQPVSQQHIQAVNPSPLNNNTASLEENNTIKLPSPLDDSHSVLKDVCIKKYPTRQNKKEPLKKIDDIISLSSSQLTESQTTDSGFETSSDLSVTPLLTLSNQSNATLPLEPLNSVENVMEENLSNKIQIVSNNNSTRSNKVLKSSRMNIMQHTSLMGVKCCICDSGSENLVTCNGHCFRGFHLDCLGIIAVPRSGFCCDECLITPTVCYQCKNEDSSETGESLVPCNHVDCDKHYHLSCVNSIKSFVITDQKLECGLHSCAKCTSTGIALSSTKLLQCIRCPLALHKTSCLIGGCQILNDQQMICYAHIDLKSVSLPQSVGHFNMNTCLDCGEVGNLICCDFCSAAYHNDCLSEEHKALDSTGQEWLCPCCLSHDLPTYESVVMCKCGSHRWWPAEVISDNCIPRSLCSSKPSACMFLVRFFGTEQYFWTHHGRVIAFTEECLLEEHKKKKSYGINTKQGQIQAQYSQAFEEALVYYKEWKSNMEGLKQHKKESKTFIHIKRNKYLVPRDPVDIITDPCKCTDESPCTPDSNCINRAIYTECLPDNCPAKLKCQNQKIRLAQNAPAKTFYTGGRGWGLKATEDISCGDFVIEYIGEVLNMNMVRERLKGCEVENVSNFYFLTLGKNLIIDASTKSNNARFINHSCDPNCQTQKWKVNGETRIGIFAIKDITAGTELTFDYMLDSLGNEKKQCLCGSRNCSGFLGVKPKNAHKIIETSPLNRKRKGSAIVFASKFCKTDPYDDDCFVCKTGGTLLMCDYPDCSRSYHTECINLKKIPKGKFICPRHVCFVCSEPTTTVFCSQCPSAFCENHADNNMIKLGNEQFCTTKCIKKLNSS